MSEIRKSGGEDQVSWQRRVTRLATVATVTTFGLAGCGPMLVSGGEKQDRSGLTEFTADPNAVVLNAIKQDGQNIKIELERTDRQMFPHSRVDPNAVDCGKYDGATNPTPDVWPDGNGVNCYVKVRSGDSDHVMSQVTEITGEPKLQETSEAVVGIGGMQE